jgi:signal transduction histidine kinase
MPLVHRLFLVLALASLCIAAGLGYAYHVSKATIRELAAEHTREHAEFMASAINLQGTGIETLVSSYSWWHDMVKYMAAPDPEWAGRNVDNIVGIPTGGEALWVLAPDWSLVHSIDVDSRRPPLPFTDAAALEAYIEDRYTFSFFMERSGQLWQVFGAAIQSPEFWRHETPVEGYLLLGKLWDSDWLARLGNLSHARLSVVTPGRQPTVPRGSNYQFSHPVTGLDGEVVATIWGVFDATAFEQFRLGLRWQLLIIALALFTAVAILAAFVILTVLRPLGQITRSLEARNPHHLLDLLGTRGDFGIIARLLASQFRQGRMLREEIARQFTNGPRPAESETNAALRGRLASDLHDGPLQSLYAAGLKLSGLEARLKIGQVPSTEQLAGVRRILTDCGTNLRHLLFDLEPRELQDQDLETALQQLERNLQFVSRHTARLEIAEGVLDGIAPGARNHVYYIARELVSNASRHAQPNHILLSFSRRDAFLHLRWENDGFTPAEPPRPGHGLHNIGQRVQQLDGTWHYRVLRGPLWQVEIDLPFTALADEEITLPRIRVDAPARPSD